MPASLMHTYSTYSYMIFAISVQAILIWNSFLSIDQSTFKGGIIRGQTTRLTDKVKVTKLLPEWMGLDKIVYYSATTKMAVNIYTKFEPKIILSQKPEDLQMRLTCQNSWGGWLTMAMAPSIIFVQSKYFQQ